MYVDINTNGEWGYKLSPGGAEQEDIKEVDWFKKKLAGIVGRSGGYESHEPETYPNGDTPDADAICAVLLLKSRYTVKGLQDFINDFDPFWEQYLKENGSIQNR